MQYKWAHQKYFLRPFSLANIISTEGHSTLLSPALLAPSMRCYSSQQFMAGSSTLSSLFQVTFKWQGPAHDATAQLSLKPTVTAMSRGAICSCVFSYEVLQQCNGRDLRQSPCCKVASNRAIDGTYGRARVAGMGQIAMDGTYGRVRVAGMRPIVQWAGLTIEPVLQGCAQQCNQVLYLQLLYNQQFDSAVIQGFFLPLVKNQQLSSGVRKGNLACYKICVQICVCLTKERTNCVEAEIVNLVA